MRYASLFGARVRMCVCMCVETSLLTQHVMHEDVHKYVYKYTVTTAYKAERGRRNYWNIQACGATKLLVAEKHYAHHFAIPKDYFYFYSKKIGRLRAM